MKKTLYIIVLTLCFLLALIGKSYGQGLKVIDENPYSTVLNSIKKGDFFYNVEAFSRNIQSVSFGPNPEIKDIFFVKRNISGQFIKKINIGMHYHDDWVAFGHTGAPYYYYNIIANLNNEFTISFIDDSINNGSLTYFKPYFKICKIKEQSYFSVNSIYYDTLTSEFINGSFYPKYNRYNTRNVNITSNNNIVFTKSDYNIDSTYSLKLLIIDNNGNLLYTDRLFDSKTNDQTLTFINNDTIFLLRNEYQRDTLTIYKYTNDLNRIQLLKFRSNGVQPRFDVVYLKNNDLYSMVNNDSFRIRSIMSNIKTQGYEFNYTIFYEGIYSGLRKFITANNDIALCGVGTYSDNNIVYFKTSQFYKKYTHSIIPKTFKFNYRGILREATATTYSYASEEGDSCIYVFGNITLVDDFFNPKNLLFLKKVCGANKVITGNVFADYDDDCNKDTTERVLRNITITDVVKNFTFFTTTDLQGNYIFNNVDTGTHLVSIRPNINYPFLLNDSCYSKLIRFDNDTFINLNLSLKPVVNCVYNVINVSTSPPFRIGQPQTYYVNYCNNGTILSPNTYITIKLDSLLDFNSATIPYTTLPNHTYRFNIGNLDYLTCGNFSFVATPRIGVVQLWQTLCTEAHIYPDTVCTTPNYTGSYIVASAQCLGDSVELKLENRGGDMQSRKRYIVIEDQVMRIDNTYQLPRNGTLIEKIPADSGHTYRIIAEQEDDFPASYGDKFATAAIEACRPNPSLNFSTGYFTQFPNYDGEPFRAVSCNVITGSYDPNNKVPSPIGYAAQHYIEKNTQIDYQINFQNTGNDTAFKVVLVDTIAPTLDINSIQLSVASHAYQFQRTDSNVVQFVFDNILLVDSFRNEPKSHGFVKFKIQQKLNNPNGTKIYNKADIYFDYNAPIVTNQTYHTVGQNFITVRLISSVNNPKYKVKEVKVFPNPFREKTQIIVEAESLENPVLWLMNIEGKAVKTISSNNNNTFDIYREDLSNGMYLFKIMQGNDEVANGKVVLQ